MKNCKLIIDTIVPLSRRISAEHLCFEIKGSWDQHFNNHFANAQQWTIHVIEQINVDVMRARVDSQCR